LKPNNCENIKIGELDSNTNNLIVQLLIEIRNMKEKINKMEETMNQGFQTTNKTIDQGLQTINQGFQTLIQDTFKLPALVVILPVPRDTKEGWLSRINPKQLIYDRYCLYFLCSHTLQLVTAKNDAYVFDSMKGNVREFIEAVKPVITMGLVGLKIATICAGLPVPISGLSELWE
jgi:hypothetical protein